MRSGPRTMSAVKRGSPPASPRKKALSSRSVCTVALPIRRVPPPGLGTTRKRLWMSNSPRPGIRYLPSRPFNPTSNVPRARSIVTSSVLTNWSERTFSASPTISLRRDPQHAGDRQIAEQPRGDVAAAEIARGGQLDRDLPRLLRQAPAPGDAQLLERIGVDRGAVGGEAIVEARRGERPVEDRAGSDVAAGQVGEQRRRAQQPQVEAHVAPGVFGQVDDALDPPVDRGRA